MKFSALNADLNDGSFGPIRSREPAHENISKRGAPLKCVFGHTNNSGCERLIAPSGVCE